VALSTKFPGEALIKHPDLPEKVLDLFRLRGISLGCAESCTGGLLGARITALSGASEIFWGGIISYANSVKEELLGVPAEIIKREGAVSEPCAQAMALGARKLLGVDWAISITGIAGPGGGSPQKPVGTVCFAFAGPEALWSFRRLLLGDRVEIRNSAVCFALAALLEAL